MKNNNIYRQNFSVKGVNYQMCTPIAFSSFNAQPGVLKNIIKNFVWVQKGLDNTASYFTIKDVREVVEFTMDKIKNNPAFIEKMHTQAYEYNKKFFKYSKQVLKLNLSKLTGAELIKTYDHLCSLYKKSHNWALSTTWFIDSDQGDFSKFALNRLRDILAGKKVNISQIFSDLSTPAGNSMSIIEERESLELLREIKKHPKLVKIFLSYELDELETAIKKADGAIYNRILRHKNKYTWLPFGYIGPAYQLEYFLSVWQGLLKERFPIQKRITELEHYAKKVQDKRENIFKKYNISAPDKRLFNLAADIIYLKSYRKDSCYLGMYTIDKIMREVAKRLHISPYQAGFLASWEVGPALRQDQFSVHTLNERAKFSVYHQTLDRGIIYTGQKAKTFLKKCNIEKNKISQSSQLQGMTAYPGKVKGVVKIINTPEDMNKMKSGDILVAHTTAPALVPAMKKAAAIITDDGGITCHAAIVSRELKIPCIVGIKTATQVLEDGVKVEVDAGAGLLNILI